MVFVYILVNTTGKNRKNADLARNILQSSMKLARRAELVPTRRDRIIFIQIYLVYLAVMGCYQRMLMWLR